MATRCARATRYCREAVLAVDGVDPLVGRRPGRARVRRAAAPSGADVVIERMADAGFLAGISLVEGGRRRSTAAEHGLLIAATERRTAAEIDAYAAALAKAVA